MIFYVILKSMTIQQARIKARTMLQNSHGQSSGKAISSTPQLDADCLLAWVLNKERSWLFAHSQEDLSQEDEVGFFTAIEKRLEGLSVAYITEKKEFFGYDFLVTPAVLIPKPDTELLVEHGIAFLNPLLDGDFARFNSCGKLVGNKGGNIRIADICTGSACIAVSVLKYLYDNLPNKNLLSLVNCDATDISPTALAIARHNADTLLPASVRKSLTFFEGDLLAPLCEQGSYHLIMSNPPYIPSHLVDELLADGRNEPRLALDGDVFQELMTSKVTAQRVSTITQAGAHTSSRENLTDGLAIIRRLIPQVWDALFPGGVFLLETGEYNAKDAALLMTKIGFSNIIAYEDLGGQPRLTYGQKPV